MELSQQYRQLDDPYLQARYIDIEDICSAPCAICRAFRRECRRPASQQLLLPTTFIPQPSYSWMPASLRPVPARWQRTGSRRDYRPRGGDRWLSQQGEALNSVQPGETIVLDMRHQRLIRD